MLSRLAVTEQPAVLGLKHCRFSRFSLVLQMDAMRSSLLVLILFNLSFCYRSMLVFGLSILLVTELLLIADFGRTTKLNSSEESSLFGVIDAVRVGPVICTFLSCIVYKFESEYFLLISCTKSSGVTFESKMFES